MNDNVAQCAVYVGCVTRCTQQGDTPSWPLHPCSPLPPSSHTQSPPQPSLPSYCGPDQGHPPQPGRQEPPQNTAIIVAEEHLRCVGTNKFLQIQSLHVGCTVSV